MPTTTLQKIFRSEQELANLPVSERIRYRLIGADCRYHANDNISDHIREGELEQLKDEVAVKMQSVFFGVL